MIIKRFLLLPRFPQQRAASVKSPSGPGRPSGDRWDSLALKATSRTLLNWVTFRPPLGRPSSTRAPSPLFFVPSFRNHLLGIFSLPGFCPVFQGLSHFSGIFTLFRGLFPDLRDFPHLPGGYPSLRDCPISQGFFPLFQGFSHFSGVFTPFQGFFHLSGMCTSYPGDAHPPSHSWDARLPSIRGSTH